MYKEHEYEEENEPKVVVSNLGGEVIQNGEKIEIAVVGNETSQAAKLRQTLKFGKIDLKKIRATGALSSFLFYSCKVCHSYIYLIFSIFLFFLLV